MSERVDWKWVSQAQLVASVIMFALGIWLAWPFLAGRTYPHVPLRAYGGLACWVVAHLQLSRSKRSAALSTLPPAKEEKESR